jgi:hypothetical protein
MELIIERDTKTLSKNELMELGMIQKDMWAFWLWEYVKCNCCNEIHSKNDVFWHLSSEIRRESVTKLEEIYLWDSIKCKNCKSTDTEFLYDIDSNVNAFINRYRKKSFLVLSYNDNNDIIGFCDGYIDNLLHIYETDLKIHYPELNLESLSESIKNKLSVDSVEKILFFSSMWTYEKYSSLKIAYDLFKNFLNSVNLDDEKIWFTELDKNNPLYFIYDALWKISLWISKDIFINTHQWYNSDLCVFPRKSLDFFRENWDLSLRSFLKNFRLNK